MNNVASWTEYHQTIATEFFNVCSDKTVLEIAPFGGHQTQAIIKHPIKSLLLVEPNRNANKKLIELCPTATIINDDIFNVYHNKFLVDVVVACGLLYHLHSPLYLLELIANQSDPEYIILDSVYQKSVAIKNEIPNIPGNRYTTTTAWKSVNYNICVSFEYIDQSLAHLGYKCIKKISLSDFNVPTKENSWMASWQKEEAKVAS
jgi:16S rRNA A1518/A1519 N6-dimethyltransferase RsmA/KsgA/DIM1 with predicted DNA glycosylase/AP lyase activity